jgi:hypothetical protein
MILPLLSARNNQAVNNNVLYVYYVFRIAQAEALDLGLQFVNSPCM